MSVYIAVKRILRVWGKVAGVHKLVVVNIIDGTPFEKTGTVRETLESYKSGGSVYVPFQSYGFQVILSSPKLISSCKSMYIWYVIF